MTAPALPRGASSVGATRDALSARIDTERSALTTRFQSAIALFIVAPIVLVIAGTAAMLADGRWMSMPRLAPLAWVPVALLICWPVVRRVMSRFPEVRSSTTLAGAIESEQSLRSGSLRGALEVGAQGALGAHAASAVARRLSPSALTPQLAKRLQRVQLWGGALAIVSLASILVARRAFPDGLAAVMHPIKTWQGTLLPALGFEKLPTSVPRGMPLTVHVRAEGRHAVTVSQRASGEAWHDTTLTVSAESGVALLALGPVRAPVTLRVGDGRAPTAEATVAVDDRGWIGDVALFAEYPAYLGRTNETLEAVSPVRVPRGTRVRVTAMLRGGVTDAHLTDGGVSVSMQSAGSAGRDATRADAKSVVGGSEGLAATGHLLLDHDGTWKWQASSPPSTTGATLPPELPDSLAFVVMPDKAPEIMIASPVTDTAIGTAGVVPVIVRAGDDHGVGNVALTIWREPAKRDASGEAAGTTPVRAKSTASTAGGVKRERIDIGDPAAPFFEGGVNIPLDGRGLEPGDRLHLVAVATDDSPWRQQTSSTEVILRVPTLSEQRSMARSLADSLVQRAQQMANQEKQMQQATSNASRSRDMAGTSKGDEKSGAAKADANKSSMSFQAAEKARQMARDQQQMTQKIDSLRQSAKELENRLKSAGALDTALSNRMKDIQKMLRDAMTPEMQKQLEQLNKSTDRLSGTEAQQSMEQLAQQQQQLRQQLEKSAEMLKRAALEGAMSTLRDEAKELANAQKQLADKLQGDKNAASQKSDKPAEKLTPEEAKQLADRSRALQEEVNKLAKRLEDAGAKPGASKTRAAQPMIDQAADAMDKAAKEALKEAQKVAEKDRRPQGDVKNGSRDLDASADKKAGGSDDKNDAGDEKTAAGAAGKPGQKGEQKPGAPSKGQQGGGQQSGGQQQGAQGQQQAGQQGSAGQQGGQQSGQNAGNEARQAGDAMDKAAQQLSAARESQVDAWKGELSDQLDQSINETMQLARQQADLEKRARQGGDAQSMQGEQGALQQGVQQAAERLEKAGRSSSLLSQRSQKAMADAQRRVSQATQQMGQPGGNEQSQNAMKDASEALNQALSSLVRDREKVNNAQSASGFTEMMEQLKQLAQKQGSLNGQMQGLNLLPGGAQGDAAKQQTRVLARQQRDVAKTLSDVSDADQTGRTDALAKEAQTLAQQIERSGVDPSVAARQQQLYRRLLDAGRFLEQDEKDDQGPREAKAGSGAGAKGNVDGPQSGKAGAKFAPPTWNDLRGLGPEERRLVIEYFRRLNGSSP